MPILKKKAKILSTVAVQKILDAEMPGFRVVELAPEPEDSHDVVSRKASRSLPPLTVLRGGALSVEADDEPAAADESALWGNSSQFALVEPAGPATCNDPVTRRRRTVIVSHGKVITEQG